MMKVPIRLTASPSIYLSFASFFLGKKKFLFLTSSGLGAEVVFFFGRRTLHLEDNFGSPPDSSKYDTAERPLEGPEDAVLFIRL